MNAPPREHVLQTCVLTPVGRGAIATLAVRGPTAGQAVAKFFRPAVGPFQMDVDRIRFGLWSRHDEGAVGESVVVCAGGAAEVEIHCHGGRAAVESLIDDLVSVGAVRLNAEDWTHGRQEGFLAGECWLALSQTQTERTAAIVLDQIRGALRDEVLQAMQQLSAGRIDAARERIESLADRYAIGRAAVSPFRVVIAGPPNVGKSSLMNKLLGYDRAIAYDQPGTTRDVLAATTTLDGWTIELLDTAGIHDTDESIEWAGVLRARGEVQSAHAVLIVVDALSGWSTEHEAIAALTRDPIRVWNKMDLIAAEHPLLGEADVATSAVSGAGIEDLIAAILHRVAADPPAPGSAMPITQRQFSLLVESLQAIDAAIAAGGSIKDLQENAGMPLQRLLTG